jgi:Kef-type K+ transport system membrane component KefB
VEQLLLIIILAYFFQLSKWLSAIVGIFALIVVTTAAFQKFIWEYKFRWAEDLGKSAEYAIPIIDEQREFIESLIGRLKK